MRRMMVVFNKKNQSLNSNAYNQGSNHFLPGLHQNDNIDL
jgi:hypothetical protein